MSRGTMLLLLLLVAAVPGISQDRDTPVKETGQQGILRGRVVAADTGRPVARAQVMATAADGRAGPSVVPTDVSGGFEFSSLPQGRYIVVASKSGAFLDTQYGQVHPDLPGKVVTVSADTETAIDIEMMRPGVIAGRVFDEAGDPLPNATIMAMRQQSSASAHKARGFAILNGVRINMSAGDGRATSNDRGEFRLFGLEPGEYLLMGMARANRRETRRPVAIYFPGVTDPAAADRLQIGPGQEIANADFTIRYIPAVVVSGIAVGPDEQPLRGGTLSLHVVGVEGLAGLAQNSSIQKDGAFRFEALSGQYILRARHPLVGAPESAPYSGDLSLAFPLAVAETDISGLFLKLTYGAGLKGRIVLEGSSQAPPAGKQVRIMVESGSPGATIAAQHNDAGTFTMTGIEAGPRRVMTTAPAGWILKGMFLDGRDISDLPIDFQEGVTVGEVSVVFTDVKSPLTVTVQHSQEDGAAAVVVFPHDPALWHAQSRRTRIRAATAAHIVLDTLPPGDYLVAAIADVAARSLHAGDLKLLERLRPFAEQVRIVEGIPTSVRLRAVVLPQ